jgi:phage shock protein A
VNDSVQRAQTSVALQSAGAQSRIGSAADSLQRIKQRQAINEEKLRAGQELEDKRTGADLDAKLRDAGILPGHSSADDVLARLSARPVTVVTPMIGTIVPVEKDRG